MTDFQRPDHVIGRGHDGRDCRILQMMPADPTRDAVLFWTGTEHELNFGEYFGEPDANGHWHYETPPEPKPLRAWLLVEHHAVESCWTDIEPWVGGLLEGYETSLYWSCERPWENSTDDTACRWRVGSPAELAARATAMWEHGLARVRAQVSAAREDNGRARASI